MSAVGIIAEYNPFHNGHKYHIEQAKRVSGADKAVVIMSGSFVQRGEPACADKFVRAGWAVDGGADMVIELPEVFSLACAERFAAGAVRNLAGTGIVSALCFGSECADEADLYSLAVKAHNKETLDTALKSGLSYPAAMSEALGVKLGPNDILAVEYIRAVKKYCPGMRIFPIKREGGGYDSDELDGEFSSANAIRKALSQYNAFSRISPAVFDGLTDALPRNVLKDISDLMKNGMFPSNAGELSNAVLYKLRCMSIDEIAALPEAAEGLENLFVKHSMDSSDIEEMLSKVKSRRYTMARLKRISMNALLGITADLQYKAYADDEALYARVLAVKRGSEGLIAEMNEKASVPIVVRSSDRNALPPLAASIARISARAHAVHSIGRPYEKQVSPDESYRLIVR